MEVNSVGKTYNFEVEMTEEELKNIIYSVDRLYKKSVEENNGEPEKLLEPILHLKDQLVVASRER